MLGDLEKMTFMGGRDAKNMSFDDLCLAIKGKFEAQKEMIEQLREENAVLKDEAYSRKELAEMKRELDEMREDYYRGFPISGEEAEKIEDWKKQHDAEKHHATTFDQRIRLEGVSGGRYKYIFVPTAIGTSGVIRCSCGAEFEFQKIG